ncbi:MAG: MgtC/SapB family protein [Oscillospiraceae bacterium]|nr:MgtC/SapB family protein [Oscillospiraceae bacterium]
MTWNEFFSQIAAMKPGILEIALRLGCAMLIGIVIGLEREYTHRPAGLRTHILVVLGACVVSITGELLFNHYLALGATPDPARLSAQVITGVGFLGAGTIMKEGASVKGLTTAASVWAVACLGLAAGYGYYTLALLGMVFIFITLTAVEALQHRFIRSGSFDLTYTLETADIAATLGLLNTVSQAQKVELSELTAQKTETGHCLTFRAQYSGRRNKKHQKEFFDALAAASETISVSNAGTAV